MGIKLILPIKIKVDKVGAMYLAKNFSISQNTKYIDSCRNFVWEHQEEGTIDTLEDKEAEILMKITLEEIFLHNQSKLMQDVRTIK
jgi:Zn-finger protein